jgi:uncharacterized Zn ribbon protein
MFQQTLLIIRSYSDNVCSEVGKKLKKIGLVDGDHNVNFKVEGF